MTETAWRNWAGNERATPARFATPTDAADVATEIGRARRDGLTVRAVGSGHSFTGAAVTSGVMLRPDAMRGIVSVDEATGLVEVAAGTPLHELNPQLAEHGLALEIMGDIDRQTIAGAVSTGTHGSGRNFGSISTQVRALELVLADGSIVTCSETERPELFAAARVSVGALGVVTTLTLQCVPLYALHAVDEPRPLDATLNGLDELVEANDHFEFFWFPHSRTALTRRFRRLPRDTTLAPMSSFTRTLDDRILTNVGFEAMLRVGTRFPRTVPSITRFVTRAMSARDFTDLAPNVFASARNVRFREGEYAVPRDLVAQRHEVVEARVPPAELVSVEPMHLPPVRASVGRAEHVLADTEPALVRHPVVLVEGDVGDVAFVRRRQPDVVALPEPHLEGERHQLVVP